MQRAFQLTEERAFRLGAGAVGGTLFASAALAADLARLHMKAVGTICGAGSVPHCGWCYAAAGLVLAGLAATAVALDVSKA